MRHLFFVPLLFLGSSVRPAAAVDAHLDLLAGAYDGTFESVDVVNFVAGSEVFYNAGYFGQRAVVANVEAGHVWSGRARS